MWLPNFRLNKQRSRDNVFFPYVQQLLDLGLTIINPQSRATHVAGAVNLVFVSTYLECDRFTVHQGHSCCVSILACCPSLTLDHFPCTWSLRSDQRSSSPSGSNKPEVYSPESNLGCQFSVAPTHGGGIFFLTTQLKTQSSRKNYPLTKHGGNHPTPRASTVWVRPRQANNPSQTKERGQTREQPSKGAQVHVANENIRPHSASSLSADPCSCIFQKKESRMLDFGQFDFGQFDFGQLAEIVLAEVEIGRSRN